MKPPRLVQSITLFLFSFAMVSMSYSADKNETSLSRFQITENKIKGWTVDTDGFRKFGSEELYDIINGGAEIYINEGLQKGIHQRLINNDDYQCEIFVEDYGSSENASNIFITTTETNSYSPKFYNGDIAHIRMKEFIGGILLYLQHENYYLEISISGFDTIEDAITNIKPFISFFENILLNK